MPATPGGGRFRARVKDIEVAIRCVSWMKDESEQTLLAANAGVAGADDAAGAGNIHENGPRRDGEISNHRNAPLFFDDEEPVGLAWRGDNRHRIGEAQTWK